MHRINCADCGAERTTRQSNTRYCKLCRVLRDTVALNQARTTACAGCQKRFRRLFRNQRLCVECDPAGGLPSAGKGAPRDTRTCAFCDGPPATHPRLHPDLRVCAACAQDPTVDVLPALIKKRRAQLARA